MFLQVFLAILALILFVIVCVLLYYVSAAYQSTTTISRDCNFWYYYHGKVNRVERIEVTVAGTLKRENLANNLENVINKFLDDINGNVYITEKQLALVELPASLASNPRRPSKGSLESITHQLFRQLMNTEKDYKGWITEVRLITNERSASIKRCKPTNFVL